MQAAIERNSWRLPQDDVVQVVNRRSKIKHIPEDLSYNGLSDTQYWRSVVLALLVISLVIAGIASAVFIYGFVDELLYWSGENLRLEDVVDTPPSSTTTTTTTTARSEIFPYRLPSRWIASQNAFVYQSDDGHLSLYNATSDHVTVLIYNYTLHQINVKEYKCSYDLKYILLESNINQHHHHHHQLPESTTLMAAHFTVYTVKNGDQKKLYIDDAEKFKADPTISMEMQSADWAGRTNNIVLVNNNDIFYVANYEEKDETGEVMKVFRITYDGMDGVIYNGIADWLYREEIFLNSKKAYWPSSDGCLLVYASFDDSQIPPLQYPWIEKDPLKVSTPKSVRYPMPGGRIPQVKLWLANITSAKSNESYVPTEIQLPNEIRSQEYYLTSVDWINDSNTRFYVLWMSRTHTISVHSYCEAPSGNCSKIYVETAAVNMWLEIQHPPVFSVDEQSFLMIGPVQERGLRYYSQIKYVTIGDGHTARIMTHAKHDVLRILAWDTVNHIIYYIGMAEDNTGKQHLYTISDENNSKFETRCITCDLTRRYYQNCSYFDVFLSASNPPPSRGVERFVVECGERPLPVAGIHNARNNNSLVKILYDERDRSKLISQYAMPKFSFKSIALSKGHTARVEIMHPPSWRPELRDAAYPVIVHVNGRPNSQLVTRKWQKNWGLYMSTRNGIVYIKIDVRGCKGQSSSDLYGYLGDVEVKDQISVIKSLLSTHKYLDSNRIGVWGWGYGGYVATILMSSQYNIFKCGIAVSPITDWRRYNAAFTEKILGYSTASNEGYTRSDLRTRISFITTDSLYIIQGLADLSVPYQHGALLANTLTQLNKLFQHQIYANEDHQLGNVLLHMYRSMENYFSRCLTLEEEDSLNQ